MQNKTEAAIARIEEAEERISELEGKIMAKEEAEKKRDKKKSRSMRGELENKVMQSNGKKIYIIGIPEEEEREKGVEGVLEQIIAGNFTDLGKKTGIEIQETQRTPFRHNLN